MTTMEILLEITATDILFRAMNPAVSEWMQRLYPTRYSPANNWVSFENPTEMALANKFREHVKSAGFRVPSDW